MTISISNAMLLAMGHHLTNIETHYRSKMDHNMPLFDISFPLKIPTRSKKGFDAKKKALTVYAKNKAPFSIKGVSNTLPSVEPPNVDSMV